MNQIPTVRALAAAAALVLVTLPILGTSHREAPAITRTPQVDGTDFYMFRSYEPGRDRFVTLIANYNPLQDPYGGPNYFPLDYDAFYDIHINNNGADGGGPNEDITFRFRFRQHLAGIELPVGQTGASEQVPVALSNISPFTTWSGSSSPGSRG